MTLQHFNTLSEHKQHRKLLVNGTWLAERHTEDSNVLLFQLDTFYVEVYFTKQGDEIVHSHSFETTDELDPYLQDIDLSCVV